MGVPDTNIDDLERQRLQLEGNVRKLEESLYHWRTWEAEYDGLKEEIGSLSQDATTEDLLQIGRDFGGALVTENEVQVLLGGRQGVTRSRKQVVDLITKRIDYVKQNVATMEKRLQTAEDQLSGLEAAQSAPAVNDPEYPTMDIMEELDAEGEVVSSSVNTPGDHAPELLEVLKKAGVKDIPDVRRKDAKSTEDKVTEIQDDEEEGSQMEKKDGQKDDARYQPTSPERGHAPVPEEQISEPSEEQPVTDVDESPEDAKLRREMLEYGLNEVGSVVAELELDDNGSEISLDDGYGSYDYESEADEEEDDFGRSTGKVLDEDYHQQMRDLEAKLNARGMYNMGKDADTLPDELRQDLERPSEEDNKPATEKKSKKKVAFAEDIDIAPSPKQPAPEKKATPPAQPDIPAVSDSIVERTEPAEKDPAVADPPKKTSRFKSARHTPETNTILEQPTHPPSNASNNPPKVRSTQKPGYSSLPLFPATPKEPKPFSQPISDNDTTETPSPGPKPPTDKILADNLVERDNTKSNAAAPEPNELDEQLHRKEIATEFYHMRNRMIQRNGGFVDDGEPEIVPVETDEEAPKVSKFKAARMGG